MAFINQIVVENTTYDIGAKNLVDGFTQTTPGVNALDAAAGKRLNDKTSETRLFSFAISANSSATLVVKSSARFVVITTSISTTAHGLFICGTNSNLQTSVSEVHKGSNVAYDRSTNGRLVITNNTSYGMRATVILSSDDSTLVELA